MKGQYIWEYYNDIAAVEDNIREVEWRGLADIYNPRFPGYRTVMSIQDTAVSTASNESCNIDLLLAGNNCMDYQKKIFRSDHGVFGRVISR